MTFKSKFITISKLFLVTLFIIISENAFGQSNSKINTEIDIPTNGLKMRFIWDGVIVNSKWEPHSAILIPVRIGNIPRTFYMQFDTGSSTTIFYKNKVESINSKYPSELRNEENKDLYSSIIKFGRSSIDLNHISARENGNVAVDWNNKYKKEIIGTVGVDFFDQKIITIDYKHRQISVVNSLVAKKELKIKFSAFMYMNKSILFPSLIKNRKTILFFDSGSSRYALLTDRKTAEDLANKDVNVLKSDVQSLNKVLTANSLKTDEIMTIADRKIPIGYSTYMEGVSDGQLAMMMKLGIGGMTGNKLFLDHKLIIDTKLKRFAITD